MGGFVKRSDRDFTKTIKNHQKPSKTIKNHQKPSISLFLEFSIVCQLDIENSPIFNHIKWNLHRLLKKETPLKWNPHLSKK